MKKDFLSSVFCAICTVSCVACVRYSYEMQSAYTITEEAALKQLARMHEDADDTTDVKERSLDTIIGNQYATEVITDTPQVPVILSEDGIFWYDQDGYGMTAEAAEEFLNAHYGYCQRILELNENELYLSGWRTTGRISKIVALKGKLLPIKSIEDHKENECLVNDTLCKQASKFLTYDIMDKEILTAMAERLQNNLAADNISELALLTCNPKTFVDGHTADYLFWNTTAKLIDHGVYELDEINKLQ